MRRSGAAVVVALGLGAFGLAACEAPVEQQSGYVSEGAQDEMISERQEERIERAEERAEERPEAPKPAEERTPDVWEGPENELGAGESRHEELAPASE